MLTRLDLKREQHIAVESFIAKEGEENETKAIEDKRTNVFISSDRTCCNNEWMRKSSDVRESLSLDTGSHQ